LRINLDSIFSGAAFRIQNLRAANNNFHLTFTMFFFFSLENDSKEEGNYM